MLFFPILLIGTLVMVNSSEVTKSSPEKTDEDAFTQLEQDHQRVKNEPSKPYLKINNKVYTNKEFHTFKEVSDLIQRMNGKHPQRNEQVKENFIKDKLLQQQAAKENLMVSRDEAKEYTEKMRRNFDESANTQTKESYHNYLSSVGITEDDYWNQYAVEAYQEALSIIKVKKQFMDRLITTENSEDMNAAWEKYQQELVNRASVTSLD